MTIKTTSVVCSAVAASLLVPAAVHADRPKQLDIAIYAPSVELSTAGRVTLVNDIAAAIEAATGIDTAGKAYSSYKDLTAARPDFAILDPMCIAAHGGGKVLATATIGGETSRRWGVYAGSKLGVDDLAGKTLAYAKTGCKDLAFIEHGVFFGLFRFADFFAGAMAQADVNGAIVATRDTGKAAAVLVPSSAATGLELVLAVDAVPNPGLVVMNKSLDAALVDEVDGAFGSVGGGVIDGWGAAASYSGLAGRMSSSKKSLVLAQPSKAIVPEPDVVKLPTPRAPAASELPLLWRPPARRPQRPPP